MALQLSPVAEELLRQIAAYGEDRSDDEVIEEALRLLEEQRRHALLKAAVNAGFESFDQGQAMLLTPELRAEIWQQAREQAADLNWRPDPAVWS